MDGKEGMAAEEIACVESSSWLLGLVEVKALIFHGSDIFLFLHFFKPFEYRM